MEILPPDFRYTRGGRLTLEFGDGVKIPLHGSTSPESIPAANMKARQSRRSSLKTPRLHTESKSSQAASSYSSEIVERRHQEPAKAPGDSAGLDSLNEPSQKQRRRTLVAAGVLLLSILVFANTLRNDFVFDDAYVIATNSLIRDPRNIGKLFLIDWWGSYRADKDPDMPAPSDRLYRPVVLVTFAMNYWIGGLNPVGYHLVNVLLHFVVGFLLYGLACELGYSPVASLAAAALFIVHPIHTEAVTGIVGRAELLMTAGVLSVLWWYVRQAGYSAKPRPGMVTVFLAVFALAVLSKEQAAILPALLVVADLAVRKGRIAWSARLPNRLLIYLSFLVVLALYLVIRFAVLGVFREMPVFRDNPLAYADWAARLLTAIKVAGQYLWLCLWPAKLSVDYSYNAIPISNSLFDAGVIWGMLCWGGLLGLGAWSYFRGSRRIFLAVALTTLAFLPGSNLLIVVGTIMGERLFYLPSAGLCLLVAAAWDQYAAFANGKKRGRLVNPARFSRGNDPMDVTVQMTKDRLLKYSGLALFGIALFLLAFRTIERNREWRNMETLFRSALEVVPESGKLHYNLGAVEASNGHFVQALSQFEQASRIDPTFFDDGDFNRQMGAMLLRQGRLNEAIGFFQTALKIYPKYTDAESNLGLAYYDLGLTYAQQRKFEEAEAAFRQSVSLNPKNAKPHSSLSRLLIETARFNEAAAQASEAIRLDPKLIWAHFNRAWALERLGRLEEAESEYQQVLSLQPDLTDVKQRLGDVRRRLGKEQG